MKGKTEDIATLVELFRSSGWDEMHVEIDGLLRRIRATKVSMTGKD